MTVTVSVLTLLSIIQPLLIYLIPQKTFCFFLQLLITQQITSRSFQTATLPFDQLLS